MLKLGEDSQIQNVRVRDHVAMFFLGAINNLPYVVGYASAATIVSSFGNSTYLGLVHWADTFSGVFARFLFSWLLSINISYEINFYANCVILILALLGCALAKVFWLVLISVFFIGFTSSYGESVLLCYVTFKKKTSLLKSWSSGTGMAGILGASYSLITSLLDASLFIAFIILVPLAVIYFCSFFFFVRVSPQSNEGHDNEAMRYTENNEKDNHSESEETFGENGVEVKRSRKNAFSNQRDTGEEAASIFDFHLLKPVWWYMFNCAAVYFLEYCITGAWNHCYDKTDTRSWIYPLFNLCYQIGVFISRSSLALFKCKYVGTVSACQAAMFTLWATQPFYTWMPFAFACVSMIVTGLWGGLSYVNSFHLIMTCPTLTSPQKEVVTSWNTFFVAWALVFSTVFTFVAEKTFLKNYVPD